MSSQQNIHLPYYVGFASEQLNALASKMHISEKIEQLLFEHLCLFAKQNYNAVIVIEDFILYLTQWAERNGFGAFRIANNAYRQTVLVAEVLKKNYYCSVKIEEDELVSITLLEWEIAFLESVYFSMTRDSSVAFPNNSIFQLSPLDELFSYCEIDDFNDEVIEEIISANKILTLSFPRVDSHILVPYSYLKQLDELSREKVETFINKPTSAKLLEDIIHKTKPLMQGIKLTPDKVSRLLSEKDEASPQILFYFARELTSQLSRDTQKNISIYYASRLIERFQMLKEEKRTAEDNALKNADVRSKMKAILQEKIELIKKEEFLVYYQGYKLKSGEIINFTEITENEFATTFSNFITDTSKHNTEDKNPLPEIVRIYFNGEEYLVYRNNVISVFENQLYTIQPEIKKFYTNLFYEHLIKNQNPRYLRSDKDFAEHVEKRIFQKYEILSILLKNPTVVYNAFFLTTTPSSDLNNIEKYFINAENPIFKSSFLLLNLRRGEIYDKAYNMLPYSYKFVLFRILKSLFTSFSSLFAGKQRKVVSRGSSTLESESSEDTTKQMVNALSGLQESICHGKSFNEKMDELDSRWNIKIGEAHQRIKEEVLTETNIQVAKLTDMIRKLKRFDLNGAKELFKSVAEKIKKRYPEIRDHKALEEYIVLTASKSLRNRFKRF